MIEYINNTNIKMIIELKKYKAQFIAISVDTKISAHKFGAITIMRKINPKCSNEDSFIYSIIISLHYYDISHNPERISNLMPYISNYYFTDTTASGFEIKNPNVSLEIMDEDRNIIYSSSNLFNNKAEIIELNGCRYAAINPIKNKYIMLKEILQSFCH